MSIRWATFSDAELFDLYRGLIRALGDDGTPLSEALENRLARFVLDIEREFDARGVERWND